MEEKQLTGQQEEYCLIYVSSSITLVNAEAIEAISMPAQSRNRSLNITGLLVYLNGCTIHVMEGRQECLDGEFALISGDPRHNQVTLMYRGKIDQRQFCDWHLNYKAGRVRKLEQVDALIARWNQKEPMDLVHSILYSFYENNYRN